MAQRNINFTDEQASFIASKVQSGEFQNASEVVREALRFMQARDEERRAWLEGLRDLATERFAAFDRGEGTEMTIDEVMSSVRAKRKHPAPA